MKRGGNVDLKIGSDDVLYDSNTDDEPIELPKRMIRESYFQLFGALVAEKKLGTEDLKDLLKCSVSQEESFGILQKGS